MSNVEELTKSHARLLAALEKVTTALDAIGDYSDGHVSPDAWFGVKAPEVLEDAKAAIATAKELT